jgi:hypothetical protein
VQRPEPTLLYENKDGTLGYNHQVATLVAIITIEEDSDIIKQIRKATREDITLQLIKEKQKDKMTKENGLVYHHGLIYIPFIIRTEIIR